MDRSAVLVVDDEEGTRFALSELLTQLGHQPAAATCGEQALAMLKAGRFDAVLLDVVLPDLGGLEVLARFRQAGGTTPVIVLAGRPATDDAVAAMRLGAADYLAKPVQREDLEAVLARALGQAPRIQAPQIEERSTSDRPFISSSPAMAKVRALVERVADADVPVLLLGESGTGKEVIAREIHRRSRRGLKSFIKVNCAALPGELLESELFGHERGAFTGATAEKPGKFELADQGTIFLDEIGEMAVRLQAKLLQVLQDEEFYRVGGKKSVRVDSRVVVATNRDLEREIEAGNFREDLFYRLNVVAIRLPPLRDRREDIVPLVDHFLKKYGQRNQEGALRFPPEVLSAFLAYDWPGNVRELENVVRRLVVLNDPSEVIGELKSGSKRASNEVLPVSPLTTTDLSGEVSLKQIGKRAARLAEREAILAMLQRTAWNKRRAARKLQISYKALLYKIKETGIVDPRIASEA